MSRLAAAGAVTAALAAAVAWAQGFGPGGHEPFGPFGLLAAHHAVRELGLTPEQKARVKGILRSHREEFHEITERLHGVHDAVRQVAHQDAVDEAAIREKVGAAVEPLGDLAVLHARVRHEIHGVLTAEQREKAEALHDEMRAHWEELRKSMRELGDDWLEDPS
jgi:Spy/CpxP family protein refolding chaperone